MSGGDGDTSPWERTGRQATAMLLGAQVTTVSEIAAGVEESLRDEQNPSNDDIVALRTELLTVQRIVEECLVPHADDIEPWDHINEVTAASQNVS